MLPPQFPFQALWNSTYSPIGRLISYNRLFELFFLILTKTMLADTSSIIIYRFHSLIWGSCCGPDSDELPVIGH
ncbi:hypothetical protein SAY86_009676 [Trapa natans]|uniref:Uncharacterized protein n=1 Tax=Trapa natans TaxID=22666 RepID=A0AAN7L4W5_TRANT|nr:hypothetical protein SAY86_009676 [Trapa natans]